MLPGIPLIGALLLGRDTTRFRVWAPWAVRVEVHQLTPQDRLVPLRRSPDGYHEAVVADVPAGSLYLLRLDGVKERPDPASRCQPRGVHGPSQVVDPTFAWEDQAWPGLPLPQYIIYELHVGTFTPEGTCDGVLARLDYVRDLGITAIELMPLAQFPGGRNWGYDGVFLFAVQHSYGGGDGLKRLVNACHQRGLAVVLDVVYNHLGPEGNYLADYAPYFTDRYRTDWGKALNFDGPHCDDVRRYFLDNALMWQTEFHVDALRLDAVNSIQDLSPHHFLQELVEVTEAEAQRQGRPCHLIAESLWNDVRLIRPRQLFGLGLHAQWSDDFHHALHAYLTGERVGCYQDYGTLEHLARAWRQGYVYTGQYSPFRRRRHGSVPQHVQAHQFVVCGQNHDQVGNRRAGERLSRLVSWPELKLAAAVVLLAPFVPLLFMGEEYGETAPFPFFTSHSEPQLIEAVRRGREHEFAAFAHRGPMPDPQDEATFLAAKLNWQLPGQGQHAVLRAFYQELIRLRQTVPALACLSTQQQEVICFEAEKTLCVRRWTESEEVCLFFHFGQEAARRIWPLPAGTWLKLLDSAAGRWQGSGRTLPETLVSPGMMDLSLEPATVVVYRKDR